MSVLKHLEAISFKLDMAIKIQSLKGVDWYLVPPFISLLVGIPKEIQI